MSLDVTPLRPSVRVTADEHARVRAIAGPVGRAARILVQQGRTTLSEAELQALGMLGVWRKLASYDPARGPFDRWAFYQGLRAMIDVSREQHRETLFEATLRRTVHGHVAMDDRSPEIDLDRDTHETDTGRLRWRTRCLGAATWLQTALEQMAGGPPVERTIAAVETLNALSEEIAQLSEEQRTVLRLRFWDDIEVTEVAARVGWSERTLRRRWAELRDLLLRRLTARGILGVPEGFAEVADAAAMGERR